MKVEILKIYFREEFWKIIFRKLESWKIILISKCEEIIIIIKIKRWVVVILTCKLHVSSTVAINPFSILFTTTTTITIKNPITSAAMHGGIKPIFHTHQLQHYKRLNSASTPNFSKSQHLDHLITISTLAICSNQSRKMHKLYSHISHLTHYFASSTWPDLLRILIIALACLPC